MGLNSGEVVVGSLGDAGSLSYTAVGHTVGLAQRMESLAEPGSAYLAPATASYQAFGTMKDGSTQELTSIRFSQSTVARSNRSRAAVSLEAAASRMVWYGGYIDSFASSMAKAAALGGLALASLGNAEAPAPRNGIPPEK